MKDRLILKAELVNKCIPQPKMIWDQRNIKGGYTVEYFEECEIGGERTAEITLSKEVAGPKFTITLREIMRSRIIESLPYTSAFEHPSMLDGARSGHDFVLPEWFEVLEIVDSKYSDHKILVIKIN